MNLACRRRRHEPYDHRCVGFQYVARHSSLPVLTSWPVTASPPDDELEVGAVAARNRRRRVRVRRLECAIVGRSCARIVRPFALLMRRMYDGIVRPHAVQHLHEERISEHQRRRSVPP